MTLFLSLVLAGACAGPCPIGYVDVDAVVAAWRGVATTKSTTSCDGMSGEWEAGMIMLIPNFFSLSALLLITLNAGCGALCPQGYAADGAGHCLQLSATALSDVSADESSEDSDASSQEETSSDDDTDDDTDAGEDTDAPDDEEDVECDRGEDECDGDCVDTDEDENNCGKCGSECDGDEICDDGACAAATCACDCHCDCDECGFTVETSSSVSCAESSSGTCDEVCDNTCGIVGCGGVNGSDGTCWDEVK